MDNNIILLLFFGILGGLLPSIIWLWFWLKEDSLHPEPKIIVIATFVGGMLSVFVAGFLQDILSTYINIDLINISQQKFVGLSLNLFFLLIPFVFIEEFVKFLAAKSIAFSNKNFNEPVDAVIYMISAALGFAAFENALYIIGDLPNLKLIEILFTQQILNDSIVLGYTRFIGATVLHVVASGIFGVFIGLSFYKSRSYKFIYYTLGFFSAVLLHTIFNYSIIVLSSIGVKNMLVYIFITLWVFAILLILLFERVKQIHKNFIQKKEN